MDPFVPALPASTATTPPTRRANWWDALVTPIPYDEDFQRRMLISKMGAIYLNALKDVPSLLDALLEQGTPVAQNLASYAAPALLGPERARPIIAQQLQRMAGTTAAVPPLYQHLLGRSLIRGAQAITEPTSLMQPVTKLAIEHPLQTALLATAITPHPAPVPARAGGWTLGFTRFAPEEELELLNSAKLGGRHSYSALMESYKPRLERYLSARFPTLSYDARADVLQNAMIRAWEDIGQFDPAKGTFSAWFTRITHRQALMELRRSRTGISRRLVPLELKNPETGLFAPRTIASSEDVLQNVANEELRQKLGAAVEKLPPELKQMFELKQRRLEDQQIAKLLNITTEAAKKRAFTMRQELRRLLPEYAEEFPEAAAPKKRVERYATLKATRARAKAEAAAATGMPAPARAKPNLREILKRDAAERAAREATPSPIEPVGGEAPPVKPSPESLGIMPWNPNEFGTRPPWASAAGDVERLSSAFEQHLENERAAQSELGELYGSPTLAEVNAVQGTTPIGWKYVKTRRAGTPAIYTEGEWTPVSWTFARTLNRFYPAANVGDVVHTSPGMMTAYGKTLAEDVIAPIEDKVLLAQGTKMGKQEMLVLQNAVHQGLDRVRVAEQVEPIDLSPGGSFMYQGHGVWTAHYGARNVPAAQRGGVGMNRVVPSTVGTPPPVDIPVKEEPSQAEGPIPVETGLDVGGINHIVNRVMPEIYSQGGDLERVFDEILDGLRESHSVPEWMPEQVAIQKNPQLKADWLTFLRKARMHAEQAHEDYVAGFLKELLKKYGGGR